MAIKIEKNINDENISDLYPFMQAICLFSIMYEK
jgi:hypothetical protein